MADSSKTTAVHRLAKHRLRLKSRLDQLQVAVDEVRADVRRIVIQSRQDTQALAQREQERTT